MSTPAHDQPAPMAAASAASPQLSVDPASVEAHALRYPTSLGLAIIMAGLAASLLGHMALLIAIGYRDVVPFTALPPPSIMVDLVTSPAAAVPATASSSPLALPAAKEGATTPLKEDSSVRRAQAESPLPRPKEEPLVPPIPTALLQPFNRPAAHDADPSKGPRLADILEIPISHAPNEGGGGAAADRGVRLSAEVIEKFKDHVRSCWSAPPEAAHDTRVKVLIRIALDPGGRLLGKPVLVQGIATPAGPALVKSAIAALRQCQPYAFLPAERYQQWRVLDIGFSAEGII
jgi:hypothetical protein